MESGTSFTVMPMSQSLELKPGDTYEGYISVSNPNSSTESFDYAVEVMPYGVNGENYEADLITSTGRTLITKWITLENATGTVAPNEIKKVKYTITVPEDAVGGGQYAALVVSKNGGEIAEGVNFNSIYSLASLIYAQIDGEIIREGDVVENSISGFVTDLPIHTHAMLTNTGNSHETAAVYLTVKNFFTGEIVYPEEGASGGILEEIMPESTRLFEQEINEVSPVGIYEVVQTVNYLDNASSTTQIVIACPVWLLFILFVAVCSFIAGVIKLILHFVRKKKSCI